MRTTFITILSLLSISCSTAQQRSSDIDSQEQSSTVETAANVFFITPPEELNFAGESVPLNYPDVVESLQREMGVTMYMHSRTILTLRAQERWFDVIVPILRKYGIPEDFKYLAMAESSLNPEAISVVGASGLWQIMKGTAKEYGIETGDNVDLRFNVELATEAAAKYLKNAYNRFGNWTLAAASYNVGMAGVSRRAETQGVNNYYDLFLPEETARYIYRILSMKLVSENPSKYGFKLRPENIQMPFENYYTVEVSHQDINWSEVAQKYGTNYKILRMLNPWIRSYEYENKSGKSYTLKVPNKDFRVKGY